MPTTNRPDFQYLDGIRALAALSVVGFHAFLYTGETNSAKESLPWVDLVVGWGYLGVPVFIVLSGYLLMLPTLNSRDFQIRGGIPSYLFRRSRRILPPYFAALAVTLLLILVIPVLQTPNGTQWDTKIPITAGNTLAHVFLVHDFSQDWIGKINGPLWSVAVEWQIYFLLPFVLLPLWRRMPPWGVLFGAVVITLPAAIIPVADFAHPWLLALFVAGMWAAQKTFSRPSSLPGALFYILLALVPIVAIANKVMGLQSNGLVETTVGLSLAAGLTWLGQRSANHENSSIARMLAWKPLVKIGLFSYSIYLLHSPLLGLTNLLLLPLNLPMLLHWALMTFVAAPLAIAVCWLFFLLVEKRFLNSRQRQNLSEAEGVNGQSVPPTGVQ